jgi:hypothetical protein
MDRMLSNAEDEAIIDKIIRKNIDPETKKSLIRSARQASFSHQRKATSLQTIMSISNTMVRTIGNRLGWYIHPRSRNPVPQWRTHKLRHRGSGHRHHFQQDQYDTRRTQQGRRSTNSQHTF